MGIGNGKCRRCRTEVETIHHLYMGCKHNRQMISLMNNVLRRVHKGDVTWKQMLLGDNVGCSTNMWNIIRSNFLWHIWLQRNAAIFESQPPNLTDFINTLMTQVRRGLEKSQRELKDKLDLIGALDDEVLDQSNRRTVYNT